MTPKRKASLQFFHDRGEVESVELGSAPVTYTMASKMLADGLLQCRPHPTQWWVIYTLTDKGRRALHGDAG